MLYEGSLFLVSSWLWTVHTWLSNTAGTLSTVSHWSLVATRQMQYFQKTSLSLPHLGRVHPPVVHDRWFPHVFVLNGPLCGPYVPTRPPQASLPPREAQIRPPATQVSFQPLGLVPHRADATRTFRYIPASDTAIRHTALRPALRARSSSCRHLRMCFGTWFMHGRVATEYLSFASKSPWKKNMLLRSKGLAYSELS